MALRYKLMVLRTDASSEDKTQIVKISESSDKEEESNNKK